MVATAMELAEIKIAEIRAHIKKVEDHYRTPTVLNKDSVEQFLKWYLEGEVVEDFDNRDVVYKNEVMITGLDLTIEKFFRELHEIEEPVPPNMGAMSKDCMDWLGSNVRIPITTHPNGPTPYSNLTFCAIRGIPLMEKREWVAELLRKNPTHA